MTTLEQAARQALDALEKSQPYVEASANKKLLSGWGAQLDRATDAIAALREALEAAQPSYPPTNTDQWDAKLGRTAMRFVDRAGDVHPGIDDAEKICADFHAAMSSVIDEMPWVKRMHRMEPPTASE